MTNSKARDVFRKIMRQVRNRVKEYNDVERRLRDATSNDPWPCTSTQMYEIACDANDQFKYDSVLGMLLKRLQDHAQIMHVKKALFLAEYLLRNAPQRFVQDMKDRKHVFQSLTKYRYVIEGVDKGEDVRLKSESVLRLLGDDAQLKKLRETAERTRGRFVGISHHAPMAINERYNNSVNPFESGASGGGRVHLPPPELSADQRVNSPSASEEDETVSATSEESESEEFSPVRKEKPRKSKKAQAKKARKKSESDPEDLVGVDIITGSGNNNASAAPAESWMSAVALFDTTQVQQQPSIQDQPLFESVPAVPPADYDPFAPVEPQPAISHFHNVQSDHFSQFENAKKKQSPAESTKSEMTASHAPQAPQYQGNELWNTGLADVTKLVHPHDYEGYKMQQAREQRIEKTKQSGRVTLQQLAEKQAAERALVPVKTNSNENISNANPFQESMYPEALRNVIPQQSQPLAIMAPEHMQPAPLQSSYSSPAYPMGNAYPQQPMLALPMPPQHAYAQQSMYAPSW